MQTVLLIGFAGYSEMNLLYLAWTICWPIIYMCKVNQAECNRSCVSSRCAKTAIKFLSILEQSSSWTSKHYFFNCYNLLYDLFFFFAGHAQQTDFTGPAPWALWASASATVHLHHTFDHQVENCGHLSVGTFMLTFMKLKFAVFLQPPASESSY